MSSFTSPADLRFLGEYRFELLSPFYYHVGDYPSEQIICVPAGFVTDFASVPRLLWAIFPPHGKWAKAAIVHDFLYTKPHTRSKEECDLIFLEAMSVLGVPVVTRKLMYWAVRFFGREAYEG